MQNEFNIPAHIWFMQSILWTGDNLAFLHHLQLILWCAGVFPTQYCDRISPASPGSPSSFV